MVYRVNRYSLSFRALDGLSATSSRLEKSIEKLSTGLRINSAADDPVGLGFAERLRMQARGVYQAIQNSQNGISVLQTADTALDKTAATLQQMRVLAIQAQDGSLNSTDRMQIQDEVTAMRDDLNRIAWNTEFNTMRLLDGSRSALISSSSSAAKGIVNGIPTESGQYLVSIALVSGGTSELQRTQTFTVQGSGSLASGTTQLQSIAEFYDALSIFVLPSPQTMYITANAKNSSISVNGSMTLNQLAASIQSAMANSSGLNLTQSRAGYVGTAQTGLAGVGGYLEITAGVAGENGDFTMVADSLLSGSFGFTNARDSQNTLVDLTLRNPFGGISTVRTSTDRATGLLNGVDVKFSSQAAQIAGSRGLEVGLLVTAQSFTISAGGVTAPVNIAGGYWTFDGLARAIDAQTTTISTLTTVNDNGQLKMTIQASVSATINISDASAAATIGMNNGSYGTSLTGTHAVSAEKWGYTTFVATSTGVVSGSVGIISLWDGNPTNAAVDVNVYTASIGSASFATPDMIAFSDFQTLAANALQVGSLAIRVDQVGFAFSFTSTRVGKENRDNNTPLVSEVSLTLTSTTAALQDGFKFQFGISPGVNFGSGDKNFTLFVSKIDSNFQIGANTGERMRLTIDNMGAEALGVDNLDLSSTAGADKAVETLAHAIDTVSSQRGKLGILQGLLESSVTNLRTAHTNFLDAESNVRDVDVASEVVEFTRNSLFLDMGTSVLAQANLLPGKVLQLLTPK